MEKIIGIDLGTSNSACAYVESGRPILIPSAEGFTLYGKAFPSYVAFTKDGELLVGEPARRQAVANPEGTFMAFKRKMGTDYKYRAYGKEYTPQQLSAFLLQKIRRDAESFLGTKITKAVITVPAYFNDNQRQATKDAGAIAGLDVTRIINEPTAACLAYGIDKAGKAEKIMVFDFGGGTLDVTIMDFWKEGGFQVLSTAGDTQLGGTDIDNALIDYIVDEFRRQTGSDLKTDKTAMQRVREAVEKAKIELSTVLETDINLPFITSDATGPKHLTMKLTRAKLEALARPIIERCGRSIEQALSDARLSKRDITKIILVGGPTRMPLVQKYVEEFLERSVERGVDPMECVAFGAALQGSIITGEIKDIVLLDVTPLTLGVETLGGIFDGIIPRNTTIPTRQSKIYTTAADNQTTVEVHILQGERPLARDNTSLGRFYLDGIPPAPRGIPQIEVTFDIDENGILHVSARDKGTGKEQSIRITAPHKLSKEEIDKMMKEAERFAEEDKKRKQEIEARNELDTLIYSTEKTLKEHGEKISPEERLEIERAINDAKEALKGDINQIRQAKDKLSSASHKLAEAIYRKTTQAPPPPKEEKKEQEKKKEAIDAEFKEEEGK